MSGPPRRIASRLQVERLHKAVVGFLRIAVFHMTGRVVRAGHQQVILVGRRAVQVILNHAQANLLVVRVVALLYRAHGQGLHQGMRIVAPRQIGPRPGDALVGG